MKNVSSTGKKSASMRPYLVPVGVFVLLVVLLAVGLTLDPRLIPSPLINKPMPEFTLPNLRNPDATVSRADLLGKVLLFNVWASWCQACRQEHPLLMELARSGVVPIYGLNYKDKRPDALRWLDQLGDPYVAIAADADGRVGIEWGVYGVPETFVVDRKGIIRYKQIGALNKKLIQEKILPLVRQLQAEGS